MKGRRGVAALLVPVLVPLAGCAGARASGPDAQLTSSDKLAVVTTTGIIADLVREVGREQVAVTALVPPGADPHSYEPVPADAARIARADLAFSNHLLLEPQSLVKAVDANLPGGAPHVRLAEESEAYGAHLIPLVEDLGLDVVWLGLRARGHEPDAQVEFRATGLDGPGRLAVYLTEALGDPVVEIDSGDGLSEADTMRLPMGGHTHVNWAFTSPGVYRLTLAARVLRDGLPDTDLGSNTFTFAVAADPGAVALGRPVLSGGHADLTADTDPPGVHAYADDDAVADPVIEVPDRSAIEVPDDPRFGFLGTPGTRVHQLPQAVLGRHVHGEIDPHVWGDVRNGAAFVQLIRDTLVRADPQHADAYRRQAADFLRRLDEVHSHMTATLAGVPAERRKLVTTHDAFGYLAQAYGLQVAGFVVPNPAQEPSAAQVRDLADGVRRHGVPAVFVEPNLAARSSVLHQVAADAGIAVCTLYGDAFDEKVTTYVDMMRHNADELARCLGGST